jgi:hypothetical protein
LQQGFDGKVEALGTATKREAKKKPKKETKKAIRERILAGLEDI